MREEELERLLEEVAAGALSTEQALERLRPSADLGFARLDLHRERRCGLPEAVYAEGKTDDELRQIVDRLVEVHGRALVTRLAVGPAESLGARHPQGRYHSRARVWVVGEPHPPVGGPVAVLAAGTADLAVAEEVVVVAEWHGLEVRSHWDVGVAGVHRLIEQLDQIRAARVVIVVAGMDGALPTLVAGLVASPVVAVPTSVGYGAHFAGLAPLLTMLNACAPGVAVVNIDNGYGAAACAYRILAGATPLPRN